MRRPRGCARRAAVPGDADTFTTMDLGDDDDLATIVDVVAADLGCRADWVIQRRANWVGVLIDGRHWLRYSPNPDDIRLARAELEAARHGGPAVLQPRREHIWTGHGVATVWEYIEPVTAAAPGDLGRAVAGLHRDARGGCRARHTQRIATFAGRAHDGGIITRTEADQLIGAAFDADTRLRCAPGTGGVGVAHNDAHLGNVLVGTDGPVLVDLETFGVGPLIYDLTPLYVEAARYGQPLDAWDELVDGYRTAGGPADPSDVEPLADAASIYERWAALWAAQAAVTEPALTGEARRRIDTLCHGRSEIWTRA